MRATAQGTTAAPLSRTLTATERNWLIALAIVVGSALLFWGIGALEALLGRSDRTQRIVWHPSETSMRLIALSHFLVALAFMTTSKRMKTPGSWLWFFGLLAGGAILCVGFSRIGGIAAPAAAVLFYAYFLLHEFRDQGMFFRANGDAKGAGSGQTAVPWLVLGAIAATFLGGAALRIGGARRYDQWFQGMEPPLRAVLGVLPAVLVAVGAFLVVRRYGSRHPEGVRGWLRQNRPIFLVFAGIFLVLAADIATTGRVYAIVTLHVTAWYVFVLHQNSRRKQSATTAASGGAPSPRPWTAPWLRTTNAGFHVVHLGVMGLVVLAAAVWAYGFDNSTSPSALRVLLSREAFPYWTIMHVSVSWIPR